jgi:hypothetical protein
MPLFNDVNAETLSRASSDPSQENRAAMTVDHSPKKE